MKIIRLSLIFVIAFILCGCSSTSNVNIVYTDKYIFGQDAQINFPYCQQKVIAETNNGYYLLSGPERGFLYFYDKASKKAVLMCDKPNCLHADEPNPEKIAQCNAFLGVGPTFLEFYEGYLYYVLFHDHTNTGEDIITLNRISLDGAKHQRIYSFTDFPDELQIHRGYVYYTVMDTPEDNQDNNQVIHYRLCRIPLDNPGKKPEIIEEGKKIGGRIRSILCYGNSVYYKVSYYSDDTMEKCIGYINRYDIQTKTVTRFLSDNAVNLSVFNDKFIYELMNQGTFSCDVDGKNSMKVCDAYGNYSTDQNYLFIDNYIDAVPGGERKLTVMDKSWQIVNTISLQGFTDPPLGCSDGFFFISDWSKSNDFGSIDSIYCVSPQDDSPRLLFQFVPKVEDNGVIIKIK